MGWIRALDVRNNSVPINKGIAGSSSPKTSYFVMHWTQEVSSKKCWEMKILNIESEFSVEKSSDIESKIFGRNK